MSVPPFQDSEQEFFSMLERARKGDHDAIWALVEQYEPHIRRVVRRKLGSKVRTAYDSQDFVQMAWASFFVDTENLYKVNNSAHFISFLLRIATNKVIDACRHVSTQKYGANGMRSIDDSQVAVPNDQRMHTPSQVVIAREKWEQLIERQSPRDQQIAKMRMSGVTFDEIARRLKIGEKTARRVIERLLNLDGLLENQLNPASE